MLTVLHLTDTHVVGVEDVTEPPDSFAGAVAAIQGRTTTELLRAVLAEVAAAGIVPDLVLHTGDATDDGEAASYAVLHEVLAGFGVPVLAVAGNHDHAAPLAAAVDDEPGEDVSDPAPAVHWVDQAGWRIVGVDTSAFARAHGDLDAAGLDRLEEALAGAPGPVLVGMHHPPLNICPDPSCALRGADGVLAVLDRHPAVRAVVSGHLHATDDLERHGTAYLLSPSTCLQLRHQHPLRLHNQAPTPVGARVLELHDDGRVTSRVVWADAAG